MYFITLIKISKTRRIYCMVLFMLPDDCRAVALTQQHVLDLCSETSASTQRTRGPSK